MKATKYIQTIQELGQELQNQGVPLGGQLRDIATYLLLEIEEGYLVDNTGYTSDN